MNTNYLDPHVQAEVFAQNPFEHMPDPKREAFILKIRQVVLAMPELQRQIIIMRYFEGKSIIELALELDLSLSEISQLLHAARLRLKNALVEIVKERWPKRFKHLKPCPVCIHPQRTVIEMIIAQKTPQQSWSALNKILRQEIGEIIKPPALLIYHLKYHHDNLTKEGVDEISR